MMVPLPSKKERIERLGRIREVVFGMQDGLLSTVGFVAGLHGATADNRLVLLGGLVEMAAGAMSMAAGSYLSTRAEREVYEKAIRQEEQRFQEEPYLAYQELLHALAEEGLSKEKAYRVVKLLREEERTFFKTFQEKVLGLSGVEMENPLVDAFVMGASFAVGAIVVLFPYLVLHGFVALGAAIGLALLSLFGIGAAKAFLAEKRIWRSGLEVLLIASGAATVGYLFGLLLPSH